MQQLALLRGQRYTRVMHTDVEQVKRAILDLLGRA